MHFGTITGATQGILGVWTIAQLMACAVTCCTCGINADGLLPDGLPEKKYRSLVTRPCKKGVFLRWGYAGGRRLRNTYVEPSPAQGFVFRVRFTLKLQCLWTSEI